MKGQSSRKAFDIRIALIVLNWEVTAFCAKENQMQI